MRMVEANQPECGPRTADDGPRPASRRSFLGRLSASVLSTWAAGRFAGATPASSTNNVGYAAIAWPQSQFTQALDTISSLGFAGVQMLGWVKDAYAERVAELKDRLQKLKLQPAVLSCSKLRLDPAQPQDETANLREYAAFLRTLGGVNLQAIDGGRADTAYSNRAVKGLGEQLNALGKVAQDYGLRLGYHPHFGTVGETRQGLGRVLEATDPRYVGLVADVAHLALGGSDPAEVIRTYRERLLFVQLKDVRKDVAKLAQQNRDLVRDKKYHFCEIGTGVVEFPGVLRALQEAGFRGWIIVELDGYEPPPGGPAESARMNKAALQKLGVSV